ncbi:hypothetical protein [Luteimicrobium album]|nr:hypothetical protein [Luteimicrobium album]
MTVPEPLSSHGPSDLAGAPPPDVVVPAVVERLAGVTPSSRCGRTPSAG